MKIGLVSPIVVRVPGEHAEWEQDARIEDLARIATVADQAGLDHLTCSEHIGIPAAQAARRGSTYWDPLVTLSYLASHTQRIRLVTHVLVLGYHHPLEIAKRYGTLDQVSNGRVVLGLGIGSLREEFDLLGAPFAGRGARADDALRAIRASLGQSTPSYHGEFYDFSGFVLEPHAVQDPVPLWVGGNSVASLKRAVALGDGWAPFGLSDDTVSAMLSNVSLPATFDVVFATGRLDPSDDPERTEDRLRRLHAAGATIAGASLTSRSVQHYCEQIDALAHVTASLNRG